MPPEQNKPNPSGICMCGCGERTKIARQTDPACGAIKGEHRRYLAHHHWRSTKAEYAEEDRGYETPCWIWQRSINQYGYGHVAVDGYDKAHRMVYERERGPIPDGLHLDHLCRVRACVNPAHLEPVTPAENVRRGLATRDDACANGHPRTDEHVYTAPGGERHCRTCRREAQRKRKGVTEPRGPYKRRSGEAA